MAVRKRTGAKSRTRATKAAQPAQARDLWRASMGAVALTRKEGVKLVGQIVDQAKDVQTRAVDFVEGRVAEVRGQVEQVIGKVQDAANQNLAQVEQVVSGQVTRVLSRLGIPSKADVEQLSRRVAELNRQVKALKTGAKAA
jgi:poly(hydroxyalkanoate) granule-associated protein